MINFICEECKDVLTQFYIFKNNAKHNLMSSVVFDKLKDFLESSLDQSEPVVTYNENQFVVSFEHDTMDEVASQFDGEPPLEEDGMEYEEVVKMETDETIVKTEDFFEIEAVSEDICITDDEDEIEINSQNEDFKSGESALEDSKVYLCECGAASYSLEELQKHMNSHKRKSNVMCCGVGFRDYKCFAIHQKAHENFEAIAPLLPVYSCNDCRLMFAHEDDRTTHLEEHNVNAMLGVKIERRGSYEDHFIRSLSKPTEEENDPEDDNEDSMTCGHCRKKLPELDMKVHLLFFHTTIVFCPVDNRCFEGSKQVRLFSDHIRNKHPEVFDKNALYSCRHCKQSFTTNFEKLAHMKMCDAKQFQCQDHCNKRFATEWLLKNHLKQIQGDERYSCSLCGKRCVSKSDLQIHSRSHTNERPYSCPVCHKRFKTSANRSSHLDIHDNEKKHECDKCGEKFQTRPILRKHKKKHDEKYQEECLCKICERKYISKPHLLRHLKSSHSSPPDLTTDGMNLFFEAYLKQTL